MLSEMFCVFQKNSFMKKSVEQSKHKECKKPFIMKKVSYKFFQVCISTVVYDSFILKLSTSISTALLLCR